MSVVAMLLRDILGMFMDDRSLALVILAVVAAAGLVSRLTDLPGWITGSILVIGCIAGLIESTLNAGSAGRR